MKKNVRAMSSALFLVAIFSLVFLALFSKTFGWQFYNAVNNGYDSGTGPLGAYPFPIDARRLARLEPRLPVHPDRAV